jgi:Transposase, Mutator family
MAVLTDLRNRGVKDTFFVVCDGLKGLPEVVANVWPLAIVQTSLVHSGGPRVVSGVIRIDGREPVQTDLRGPDADLFLPLVAGLELRTGVAP